MKRLNLNTDTTLNSNSNTLASSQKAIKAYADTKLSKTDAQNTYLPLSGGTVTGGLTISRNPGTREALFKLYNESNGQGATFFQSSGSTIIAANGGTNQLTLTFNSLVQEKNSNSYPILTTADKAVANGVASLDASAKVPENQLPDVATYQAILREW